MAGRHRAPRRTLRRRIVSLLRPGIETSGAEGGERKSAEELLRLMEA